ncbi:hypothetical protein ElyMa_003033400 [Elysia marginata]|uniref:Uncharacterized protein n=1 Tax=Elysia marginata TaxID=1093978 RepID=A0AAV4II91_9GAST|nr:hypothetical protein ElyMa_003033400 [Elysia marginata]
MPGTNEKQYLQCKPYERYCISFVHGSMIDRYLRKTKSLHKIFNKNTIKISCNCMPNVKQTIRNHNKNSIQQHRNEKAPTGATCSENVHLGYVALFFVLSYPKSFPVMKQQQAIRNLPRYKHVIKRKGLAFSSTIM